MERFGPISLDFLSIFSTTNKICKEMVKEDSFYKQVLPFPSSNVPVYAFFVENGIYALWWAGLAQKVKGGQVR